MSLGELQAELRYLRLRQQDSTSSLAKQFGKEIASVEAARLLRFGVRPRKK